VSFNGVTVRGLGNLPRCGALEASVMYANNLFIVVEDTWDKEEKSFVLEMENDILPGCVITHGGNVINETIKKILEGDN